MRILIAGSSGFLGSHLVDMLLEHGHDVTVLDNLSTGKIENLAHCLDQVRFAILEASGDISIVPESDSK